MKNLRTPSRLFRSGIARGLASTDAPIDPKGGDYGAGVIRGAAILTRGEAVGHDLWIDRTMLGQVADAVNSNPKGVKGRFTHPSMSGDALGKATGRWKNAYFDGDVVRGDHHFYASAHDAPDGDLAGYLMKLAAEDPESHGTSIAFEPDREAEQDFMEEHFDDGPADPNNVDDVSKSVPYFRSPDPDNKKHLPHARLKELRAVDTVDDPAANPSGLFHRDEQAGIEADGLLAWSLGLSAQKPQLTCLDIDPDRAGAFIQRFLARHNLTLSKKDGTMPSLKPGKFEAGLLTHFAADKEDRRKETERAANEEGDADKDEGDDKSEDERPGSSKRFNVGGTDGNPKEHKDDSHPNKQYADGKMPVKCDTGSSDGEDDEDNEEGEFAESSEKQDKEEEKEGEFAKGGEKPYVGDEPAVQKEYQDNAEDESEKSKKKPKEGTPVQSPGSDKSAIGPMGDASNNVGYKAAREECKRFTKSFGPQGAVWFSEGKTFEEAQALHSKALAEENAALKSENAKLKEKAGERRGLAKPLNAGGEASSHNPEQEKLAKSLGSVAMSRFGAGLQSQINSKHRRN